MDSEKIHKYLKKINTTVERISKVVSGLKFYSAPMLGSGFQSESVHTIVEETLSLFAEKFQSNKVELKMAIPKNYEHTYLDCRPAEVSQILLNLLNNSFDAITNLNEKWIEIEVQDFNDSIQIAVTDSGKILRPEMFKEITKPFYTTKKAGKGSGLGLSICQRIIDDHQGSLWIDGKSAYSKIVMMLPKKQESLKRAA